MVPVNIWYGEYGNSLGSCLAASLAQCIAC